MSHRLNRAAIEAILPHRGLSLLLDWAEVNAEAGTATGHLVYRVEHNPDHLPGNPIMSGFDRCEMIALTLALAASTKMTVPDGYILVLGGVSEVKFRRKVRPGDEVTSEVVVTDIRKMHGQQVIFGNGSAYVNGKLVAEVNGLSGGLAKIDDEPEAAAAVSERAADPP